MLDIINSVAKNGWDRPIYFSTTAGQPGGDNFQGIKEYLQQEALAYRLIPASGYGQMNDEMTHKILTTGYKNGAIERKFSYRGLADTTITYTDDYDRMVYGTQAIFIQLAMNYVDTKQIDKAKQLLNDYNKNISDRNFPWGHLSPAYLNVIYDVYGNERGDQEYEKMAKLNFDVIAYYISSGDDSDHRREHIENALRILGSNGFSRILAQKNRTNILPKHLEKTKKIAETLGYQNI